MSRSTWDVVRAHERGDHGAVLPMCSRCAKVSVLDPCRACASPVELAAYPPLRIVDRQHVDDDRRVG